MQQQLIKLSLLKTNSGQIEGLPKNPRLIKDEKYSKCLEFGRDNSEAHPTMKPIGLIANEIQISSNIKGIVFDFFLGSGSTMVASHQLNRKCYGMELDPKYVEVCVQRMLKLDPSIEIKRNGVKYVKTAVKQSESVEA